MASLVRVWPPPILYSSTSGRRFVAGRGNMATFNREWEGLGLSKEQAGHVRKIIIRRS